MSHPGTPEEVASARDRRLWLSLTIGFFVLSRATLFLFGLRFNTEGLSWYWQILDPELLQSDLLRSVLWLHAQPPLFNFLLGLVVPCAPTAAAGVFNAAFLLISGVLVVVVFETLLEVGWAARPAALAAAALMITPGWLMYENWLFYDFPTAVLLALAALALVRWGRSSSGAWLAGFVWACCALALMRSLLHLVWLGIALALVWPYRGGASRRWIWIAAIPIVLVGALYVKNLVAFGFFGPSSWLGMSLAKMTTARLDPAERRGLVDRGILSPYVLVPPFSPLEDFETVSGRVFANPLEPAIGRRLKSTGQPNFNHLAYVAIARALRGDALTVIRDRPEIYAAAVARAWRRFFSPVSAYPPFSDNLLVIAPLFRISQASFGRPVVAAIAYLGALVAAGFGWRKAHAAGDRGLAAGAAFVLLNLVWVLVIGNLLEVGENHRFRFVVTPLVWVSLCAAVAPWLRGRRNAPPEPPA